MQRDQISVNPQNQRDQRSILYLITQERSITYCKITATDIPSQNVSAPLDLTSRVSKTVSWNIENSTQS